MYSSLSLGRKMVSSVVNDLYHRDNILRKANRGIGLWLVIPLEAIINTGKEQGGLSYLFDLHYVVITYMIYTPHS